MPWIKALAGLSAMLLVWAAGAAGSESQLQAVHRSRYLMGTVFDITVYHISVERAERAAQEAFQKIERLEQVMSHFRPDSDLSRLCAAGAHRPSPVPESLYTIIEQSLHFSRLSQGRFDITVGPLVRLWREAQARGEVPMAEDIRKARSCVGFDQIKLIPPNQVELASDCLQLDLGGIGKGYALDRAAEVLAGQGIRRALINAGGSTMLALGAPPGRAGWPIRLGAGTSARDSLTVILKNNTLSTSRQSRDTLFPERIAWGHIMDPAAGRPLRELLSVSILAPTATASDALSTATILMNREEARAMLDKLENTAAIWILPDGSIETFAYESTDY